MRMPSLDHDSWQLPSGEDRHRRYPDTFWIPAVESRQQLKRGDAVKLIFEIALTDEDGTMDVSTERMWVIVVERVGNAYIGILDNQPATVAPSDDGYLRFGAEIPFTAEHVIAIATPPSEYVEWQLGQPPDRAWPRGERA